MRVMGRTAFSRMSRISASVLRPCCAARNLGAGTALRAVRLFWIPVFAGMTGHAGMPGMQGRQVTPGWREGSWCRRDGVVGLGG